MTTPRRRPPTRTTSFGERLRVAREAAGMSLDILNVHVNMGLPTPMWRSTETLRRLEDGRIAEEKAEPLFIQRLAEVLGVSFDDLSPKATEYMQMIREQVERNSGWSVGAPAQKVTA